MASAPPATELATFAMGCFWKPQLLFSEVKGVRETSVGYTGGTVERPSYEQVCFTNTGHAEAVQVTFDPSVVSYAELLDIFWKNHNPTTENRQGPDTGAQYRAAVFCHSPEQRVAAERSKQSLEDSGAWKKPIVTQILDAGPFYPAEDYHQHYLRKRGMDSCHL